jgi:hypothetical protein
MMNELSGTRFQNPPSPFSTSLFASMTVIIIILEIVTVQSTHNIIAKAVGIVLFSGLAGVFFFLLMDQDITGKPKEVTVTEDGVLLVYRTRKQKFVHWSEIDWVSAHDSDQTTIVGRIDHMGKMKLKGEKWAFWITYDIASAIQKAYKGDLKPTNIGKFVVLQ